MTTNELCEWLDAESVIAKDDDCPVAAAYLKDAANHIRAQEARIAELMPLLKDARKELHACQAVIHLAGGFDPAYVSGAQKVLKAIDAAMAKDTSKSASSPQS